MDYKIAVLDIGKTNKKIAVFSKDLELVSRESMQLSDSPVNGIQCDRIPELNRWVFARLRQISRKHRIGSVSTTTFGATIACLDAAGELAFPVVSYMQEPGEGVRKKLYREFGSPAELYRETATPIFGQLLSAGAQIFWLKEKRKDDFRKIRHILFLPQYEGYVLTGKKSVELTSVGCHTYLFDFKKWAWSSVAKGTGAAGLFAPEFSDPWDSLGRVSPGARKATGLPENCVVSTGIHDSNASFLPYIMAKKGSFMLASTGTWGIMMYNGGSFYLSAEDMRKDTLYNINAFGKPVRTARTAMGMEHDHYSRLIEKKFGLDPRKIGFNPVLAKKIITEAKCFVVPTVVKGTGQFQGSKPRITDSRFYYRDAETAYTALNISLALQSYFAIKQAFGREEGKKVPIYVEGGFRNNSIYLAALSTLFAGQHVVATEIQEATALGAAVCGKCAAEGISPRDIDPGLIKISEKPVKKIEIEHKLIRKFISEFERYSG